jgi:sugar phosphate isomerase/epimerase
MDKCKYGITHWGLPDEGLFGVQYAAECALDGLQLSLGSHAKGYPLVQKRIREAYMEAAARFEVEFPSICISDLAVNSFVQGKNTDAGRIAYYQMQLAVEIAAKMGIPMIMVPNFYGNFITKEEHYANTIEALIFICDLAAPCNINITNETVLGWENQKKVFDAVNRPNLKLFYDSMNYWYFSQLDQLTELKKMYPYIARQLHVKDGDESFLSSFPLGKGKADFYSQADYLKQQGYCGWIILENFYQEPMMRRWNEKNEMELIKDDLKIAKRAFE